ncbi:MAG: fumarate hydratase [Proteobacteria bacterium]|jgi:fumarate hydratase class I|nr:fumarate hydratase [Pseudomonadota bacterium]
MQDRFLELIRRAACELPSDVLAAIRRGRDAERKESLGRSALDDVLKNCALAAATSRPICQDTGMNNWYVFHPRTVSQLEIERAILGATRRATKLGYLRPNAVDPLTGMNSGDNTGRGAPVVHCHEWKLRGVAADLLLKGGGSENVSAQLSLPNAEIKAGRDLEGVRRAVIEAVFQAQGKGCGPGIIGVGVGGDRASSLAEAKEQLFRLLGDANPEPELAALEARLLEDCNRLGIGPMGFGGRTTVLGVKIGTRHRLPASFFVSIAYMCWACRRASVVVNGDRAVYSQVSQIAKRYRLPANASRRAKER